MAFLHRVKVLGEMAWALTWFDATKEKKRRVLCRTRGHKDALEAADLTSDQRAALVTGAKNRDARERLRKCYDALEIVKQREAEKTRDVGGAKHDTPARDFIGAVLDLIDHRAAVGRGEHPQSPVSDPGWRPKVLESGISMARAKLARRTFELFRDALPRGATTGQLTDEHVYHFLAGLRRERNHSPGTYNSNRNIIASGFRALTTRAMKRLFKTSPEVWFRDSVETVADPRQAIEVYGADDVCQFLEAAERRTDPDRVLKVRRQKKHSAKVEEYDQSVGPDPAPVLQWALLLACTGLRRSEAQKLSWRDVNLDTGLIRIFGGKTKRFRYLPLVGDPTGKISPGFLEVLRTWRKARPEDDLVLPGAPHYPKHAWEGTSRDAGVHVTPQGLRKTLESVLAAIGFPASLACFWLGHSNQTAEAHYRTYTPNRLPGSTVDAALGLTPYLEREARGAGALRALPPSRKPKGA